MLHFISQALRVSLKRFLSPLGACLPLLELGVGHLLRESRVGHVDHMPSTSQPIKGAQCLDDGDVGLPEDTGVGDRSLHQYTGGGALPDGALLRSTRGFENCQCDTLIRKGKEAKSTRASSNPEHTSPVPWNTVNSEPCSSAWAVSPRAACRSSTWAYGAGGTQRARQHQRSRKAGVSGLDPSSEKLFLKKGPDLKHQLSCSSDAAWPAVFIQRYTLGKVGWQL
eukprot:g44407.t1